MRGASWGCSPAGWPAGRWAPKRGCLATIAIGILGALIAGGLSKLATGEELDTFDQLDLGSVFVAFIGPPRRCWSSKPPVVGGATHR